MSQVAQPQICIITLVSDAVCVYACVCAHIHVCAHPCVQSCESLGTVVLFGPITGSLGWGPWVESSIIAPLRHGPLFSAGAWALLASRVDIAPSPHTDILAGLRGSAPVLPWLLCQLSSPSPVGSSGALPVLKADSFLLCHSHDTEAHTAFPHPFSGTFLTDCIVMTFQEVRSY